MTGRILNGHVLDMIDELEDNSIDCVVTSPPYYMKRNYRTEPQIWGGDDTCNHHFDSQICGFCLAWLGELGLEPTPDLFVEHLMLVMEALRPKLTKWATVFINIDDSYMGGNLTSGQPVDWDSIDTKNREKYAGASFEDAIKRRNKNKVIKRKSLCAIPSRLHVKMVDLGWISRNIIRWHKPSVKPESVHDRWTNDIEPIFFFTIQPEHYFKKQYEPHKSEPRQKQFGGIKGMTEEELEQQKVQAVTKENATVDRFYKEEGRNARTLWSINPANHKHKHYATYPQELVRRCLDAGCPPQVCIECGKPKGWKKPCRHLKKGGETRIGRVFDPFLGSGTTALVAEDMGLNWIGSEVNPMYAKIVQERVTNESKAWLWEVMEK